MGSIFGQRFKIPHALQPKNQSIKKSCVVTNLIEILKNGSYPKILKKKKIGLVSYSFSVSNIKSPLDCKEIQPVHPKGDQSRVCNGRTDVEAETPILWPPAEPQGKPKNIGVGSLFLLQ